MRKIEQKMLRAIELGREWVQDNTRVMPCPSGGSDVYLHNHHIAHVVSGYVTVNRLTLSRWPTPTTKSRLRALGVDVYTRNWTTYLDGEPL